MKNSKHTYKNTQDDFDLSTFVKDSLLVTKEALCIDEMSTVLARRYRRILDEYPENRAQIFRMIKESSKEQCNTAHSFLSYTGAQLSNGWGYISDFVGGGFSYIYNLPTSGNAQRKGVDY